MRAVKRKIPSSVMEQAREEVMRSPTIQSQMNPELYKMFVGIGDPEAAPPPPGPKAADEWQGQIPFDYMSRSVESMQVARSTLLLASKMVDACLPAAT